MMRVNFIPKNQLSDCDKKLREVISSNLKNTKALTQAKLSEMTRILTSTLSGYFSKPSTISDVIPKIANTLGINTYDINPKFKKDFYQILNQKNITNLDINKVKLFTLLCFLDY